MKRRSLSFRTFASKGLTGLFWRHEVFGAIDVNLQDIGLRVVVDWKEHLRKSRAAFGWFRFLLEQHTHKDMVNIVDCHNAGQSESVQIKNYRYNKDSCRQTFITRNLQKKRPSLAMRLLGFEHICKMMTAPDMHWATLVNTSNIWGVYTYQTWLSTSQWVCRHLEKL